MEWDLRARDGHSQLLLSDGSRIGLEFTKALDDRVCLVYNMWSPAISQKHYQQEDKLVDLTCGNIISKLERVYYEILRRPPGDWEQSQPRDP
jgi:hypothetical protein